MESLLIIACPSCAMDNPVFLLISMLAGAVPCSYWLLKPYTRSIQTWGWPKIGVSRFLSFILMLCWLIPLWFIGRDSHPAPQVATCIALLAAAAFYLWLRACWLLDQHHISGKIKPLIFLGLLGPVLLVFGTIVGGWLMGTLLIAPAWGPVFLIEHTVLSLVVAAPLGLLLYFGLKFIFSRPKPQQGRSQGEVVTEPE